MAQQKLGGGDLFVVDNSDSNWKELILACPLSARDCLCAFPVAYPAPLPLEHPDIVERVTEFVVIVALMGAGLKLGGPWGWRQPLPVASFLLNPQSVPTMPIYPRETSSLNVRSSLTKVLMLGTPGNLLKITRNHRARNKEKFSEL